jgi:serine phosphatase RsbU (regulator of sigma subunit)
VHSPARAVEGVEPAPEVSKPAASVDPGARRKVRTRPVHLGTIVVVLVGLLITAGLSFGARAVHDTNEDRLLLQRVRETAAVVTASVPSIQTPLSSAAVLAEATNGAPDSFRGLLNPLVEKKQPFVSASLWPITSARPAPLVTVGVAPELAGLPPDAIQAELGRAARAKTLSIVDLLSAADRRLGYAYAAPSPGARYVVYAEAALPRDRRSTVDRNSAFADLGYALYLGRSPNPTQLLASSTGGDLLRGRRASESVPFGDSHLFIVMTPHKQLGGALLARLPALLAIFGVILTLAAAALVARLARRRRHAELLALENARLYADQRTIAQTLQHSLVSESFPTMPDVDVAARYVAGVEGMDVGGDWYDVVEMDDGRLVLVIGDVSGRGLRAATMMASLRFAIRAYAIQGDAPAAILSKLSRLISLDRDGQFATVLCAVSDPKGRTLTIANAGHPPPLLVSSTNNEYLKTSVGVPVGVLGPTPYDEVRVDMPAGATLLLFTDGLVERRRERLADGLDRLKNAAERRDGGLEDLLDHVLATVIPDGAADDTALMGVRWLG